MWSHQCRGDVSTGGGRSADRGRWRRGTSNRICHEHPRLTKTQECHVLKQVLTGGTRTGRYDNRLNGKLFAISFGGREIGSPTHFTLSEPHTEPTRCSYSAE